MAGNSEKTVKPRGKGKPFVKGQSGNPSGRPSIPQEFKELAQKYSIPALEAAIRIMNDVEAKESDRLKAIEIVLDRGIGKPIQSIDLDSKNDTTMHIVMDGDLESWAK